jgi:SAM-dependent methyltransferase
MFLGQLDEDRTDEAYAHATHYEAVPIADLRAMLGAVPEEVTARATFVDVGAGMGRAMMIASEYPFKCVTGVELSPALFEIAKANLASATGLQTRCRDVRLTCGDARTHRYPRGTLVAFLFNPFDGDAFRATLARIVGSRAAGDDVYVLYHTPEHLGTLLEFGGEPIAALADAVVMRFSAADRQASP